MNAETGLDRPHVFLPAEGDPTGPPLLLLHGTGGNERDLLPLRDHLSPRAAVLSVRGTVLENGMPRFFRRVREGVFDEDDLRRRADELAEFVVTASGAYGIKDRSLVAVGFSNGANTTAVLLAGQDEFILRHFDSFFLIEGGFGPLGANILQKPALKRCRFLVLRGDAPEDEHPGVRESNDYLARALESAAREFHLDFTSVVMRGAGHALPPKYEVLLGQWARREMLPALDTK